MHGFKRLLYSNPNQVVLVAKPNKTVNESSFKKEKQDIGDMLFSKEIGATASKWMKNSLKQQFPEGPQTQSTITIPAFECLSFAVW